MQPTTYPAISDIYSGVNNPASNGPSIANIYAEPGADPAAAAPKSPAPKSDGGNWFTHLLPMLGSAGGGFAGAAAGASIGSVVPVIGTGIGGIIGGILGATAGGGGAKVAENAAEGKDLTSDVGNVALESGVGQAAGGVAGKVLGKGAQYLANRAGAITKDATEAAATKATQNAELARAQAIKNNYGSISEKLQSDDHLALGSNQKLLDSLGYDAADPYQMAKAAEAGYHPTDLSLNSIYDQALRSVKPIQTREINSLFGAPENITIPGLSKQEAAMLAKAGITPEAAAKGTLMGGKPVASGGLGSVDPVSPLGKVLADFSERTNGTYGKGAGLSLPENIPATDLRKLQQAVGKEMRTQQTLINNATIQGVSNVEAEAAHNTLGKVYDDLGARIKTPEVDANIAARVTTPDERAALVSKFGEVHGNQIADTIDNAQNADNILAPMKNYTQMGQASDMAINDIENVTAGNRAVARSKTDINGDGIADINAPVLPTAGDALSATISGGVSGGPVATVAKALYHAKDNPAILNTLSRIGSLGEKVAPPAGALVGAGNAQLQSNGDTMGGTMPPTTDPGMLAASSTTPPGGLTRDDLVTLALYSPNAFNALVAPSAVNQQNVSAANTAEQALSGLGEAPGGGIISQLAGKLGVGGTGEYQRKAAAAAQQVAAALPGTDAATIEKQLTNYLAGGANIDEAIKTLLTNLQAVKQNNTNGAYQSLMNFTPSSVVPSAAGL
jgi:hypothetical protein